MTLDDVLDKIIKHEMLVEAANHVRICPRASLPQENKTLPSSQEEEQKEANYD
jgi:hypothetical protein